MKDSGRYDIQRFFNIRSARTPSFSADGSSITFLTDITGTPQVWRLPSEGGWPHQVTFYSEPVRMVEHHPREELIVFSMDTGGYERVQLYLATPDGSEVADLSQHPEAMHSWGNWSHEGRMISFSANREDAGRFDVYVQDLDNPGEEARLLHRGPGGYFTAGSFSPDDSLLIASEARSSGSQSLYLVDVSTGEKEPLLANNGDRRLQRPRWSRDGKSIYVLTDLESDFLALARIDVASGDVDVIQQPAWDVEAFEISPDGETLTWVTNEGGRSRLFIGSLNGSGDSQEVELPLGAIGHLRFSPDGTAIALALSGPRNNPDVWVCDVSRRDARRVTESSTAGIPRETFVEPELVHYESFDGLEIAAWLHMPTNAPPGSKPPVIVYPHGGPESQSRAAFSPLFAYLINNGYAIFAPNVRGSSGYGRAFMDLDNRRKRMDSVKDLAEGTMWLRDSGRIDPDRMAIYGGSYGGFMVLAAVTNYPELYAAAVDIVGIANWVTFLERTSGYRLAHRAAEYGTLEEDREFLESISPIHDVDKIRTPMLVIHGANDPRVPVTEAEQIVAALRERGVPVEYLRYDDEGHGLVKLANKLDAYPKVAAFLDKHLGNGQRNEST